MDKELYEYLDPGRSANAYFRCKKYLIFDHKNRERFLSENAPEEAKKAYEEMLLCEEAAYEYYKETGIRIKC